MKGRSEAKTEADKGPMLPDRQRILQALEKSYDSIIEWSNDAIIGRDLDGTVVKWNRGAERIYGYTFDEVKDRTLALLVLPENLESTQAIFQRVMQGESQDRQYEATHVRKDGQRIYVSLTVSPIRDAEGNIVGAATIARDITAAKQAAKALHESEKRLQDIVDNTTAVIFIRDIAGRFILINRQYERLNSTTRERVLGKTVYDVYKKEVADRLSENDRRALQAGSAVEAEEVIHREDGAHTYLSVKFPIRDAAGRAYAVGGISVDITERKHAQETLTQQARELERSNSELEQFAYVASHDLQEPLRMVVSYVQLLARRYKGKLEGDADDFIGFAVDGAVRMQQLINDLLSYSRVSTRGGTFQPVDCNQALDRAVANLKVAIGESGATILRQPLPKIQGDPTQLAQLFQNLIGNAVKFRGPEAPVVSVEAKQEAGHWLISVRDNGIGMESEYLDRIFIIFQRLHSKGEYPGTGIGLAICKKIVERHGGRIWAESQPGQGTTFHFTFPLEKE